MQIVQPRFGNQIRQASAVSVPNTRTVTAGAGLTGGGDLSADRVFDVVANADGSIVANANDVQVGVLATDAQHGTRGGGTQHALVTTTVAGFMSSADKVKLDANHLPLGYVSGATLTWASTSTVTVGTGGVISRLRDSTDNMNIQFSGTLTANIAIAGAGGLDAGVEAASTWYAVHIIADSSLVNPVTTLLSTSATAPVMPAGYDRFRRVGYVRNNAASNFMRFIQSGGSNDRDYYWDEERVNVQPLSGGNAIAYTTISLAGSMPPMSTLAYLTAAFDSSNPAHETNLRPLGSTATATVFFVRFGLNTTGVQTNPMNMPTDSSQRIQYKVSAVTNSLDIFVSGYSESI